MKIKITQTVEVDPKAWAVEFNLLPDEVRADVKEYFGQGWCQGQVEALGLEHKQNEPKKEKAKMGTCDECKWTEGREENAWGNILCKKKRDDGQRIGKVAAAGYRLCFEQRT